MICASGRVQTVEMRMLDEFDLRILRALQRDGRLGNQELAETAAWNPHLAAISTIYRRVPTISIPAAHARGKILLASAEKDGFAKAERMNS
jgi:DNA-binding Lrp family transcriptional regulator